MPACRHAETSRDSSFTRRSSPSPRNSTGPPGQERSREERSGQHRPGRNGGFESGKPTEECVKRRADVAGRRVIAVDTPGWEWYYPRNSTPDWVRRENLRSVSLCTPGPHAVLLVVRSCASVTEAFTSQIEEHLEPLGRGVWDHTLLLFTRGDELGLVSMEQRILTSGPALHNLLKRCGNRYHILDNSRSKGDATQVQELIRKVEEMVKGRQGGDGEVGYFGVDTLVLQELEADGKRRARERRKKQRQMEAQTQRGTIRAALISDGSHASELDTRQSFSKGFRRLPEVRLVLLGERETGKSSAGNTILGGARFFQMGTVTEECVRRQAEVAMRLVTVVDAPGWEGGVAGPTPERSKREIVASVAMCPPGPHALLLTLRLDTLVKVGPVTEHLELLGEGVWRHVVLLFTHGDQLREGVGIEQYIERGGRDLQWLLEKCRGRYHVISNVDVGGGSGAVAGGGSGGTTQVTELLEMVEKMAVGNRCEAFSGLVQEVSSLSQQRNEKFNQRLKEVGDKTLRQETELKKMREREVKSIRWFFDRKKKVKSPGKLFGGVEKEDEEEEEERRSGEKTKNEMGELEERMRWLTEDKEREIHDLNAEHDRILAALHQCTGEKDDSMLKLELKEREIEELLERIDEQQMKLLDLERLGSEKDRERKQREGESRVRHQELKDEIKNLSERVELHEKGKAELKKRVEDLQADICESERHHKDIISQRESEDVGKERDNRQKMVEVECKLKGEMERKLNEKEKEMEDLKLEMCQENQAEMERRLNEKDKEMEGMKLEMRTACQEKQEEMERRLNEKDKEMDGKELEMKTVCKEKQEEMESRLSEKDNEMKDRTLEMNKECQEMQAEMERKLTEKHKEMEDMKLEVKTECQEMQAEMERRLNEKNKEIEGKELEKRTLCQEKQAEMERRLNEKDMEMEGKVLEMKTVCKEKQEDMESKLSEKVNEMKDMTLEMKKECQEMQAEMERRLNEKDKEMEGKELEMRTVCQEKQEEMESRLSEKDKEVEGMKLELKTLSKVMQADMENRLSEKDSAMEDMKLETKRAFEEKVEELTSQHRREMERKIEENEREIQGMKLQHEDEMVRKMKQTEKLEELKSIQYQEEMQGELRGNEEVMEKVKQGHRDEISHIQREAERDIKEMKQQHVDKLEKISQETSQLQQRHAIQLEETRREHEKEKESLYLKYTTEITQKNKEKEREIIEFKQQHALQTEETRQENEKEKEEIILNHEKEMANIIQEKEDIVELKRQHVSAMGRELQEKDEKEQVVQVQNGKMEQILQDKERETIELKLHIENIENSLRLKEEREMLDANHRRELEQRLQEKEQEMKEMTLRIVNEKEKNVKEQEMEVEQTRQQTEARETKWREEQRKRDDRREEEIELLKQIIEKNAQEHTQTQELVTQKDKELEEAAERCAIHLKQLKENNEINTSTITEIQRQHAERERKSDAEMTQKHQEKEAELNSLKRRNSENEKEIAKLRQTIEQTNSELKELTGKVEKETTNMIGVYEGQIASIKEDIESTTQEKEIAMSQLREVEEYGNRRVSDITKKYEESQGRVKELREQNEKITKEIEDLRGKYEEHESECEAQRSGRVGREEEITELLCRYEEQVKSKDSEIQNVLHERDLEVTALKRTNETLQREVEGMRATKPKEELHDRENDARDTIAKLKTWEQSLEMREAEVCKRGRGQESKERDDVPRDSELCNGDYVVDTSNMNTRKLHGAHRKCELMTAVNSPVSAGDAHVMYQEVGVVEEPDRKEEEARGTESDRRAQGPKVMEDQRVETASSASESNTCQSVTLGDMGSTEERGGKVEMKGSASKMREEMDKKRKGNKMEDAKVIRADKLLCPSHDHSAVNSKNLPESELRVVMLRENQSSHYPVGVTILGREASQADGSNSEPWRGQIAGRNVSVVEPLGVGWRNGPDPSDTAQRKNILDSVSLSHPGPHVLLLVIPAYLTLTPKYRKAVEDHVGLFGEKMWQRTLLLFTWGETLGESTEQHILRNGDLMALIEKCGGRYHMLTSKLNNVLIEGLFEKIEDMVALNNTEQCLL